MDNLDAMLKELGVDAEIVIRSDLGFLRGYVYTVVGGERSEILNIADKDLENVISALDALALAWLSGSLSDEADS